MAIRHIVDLQSFCLTGNMLSVIKAHLSDCTFRVRVGKVVPRTFVQENSLPLGGVLSCALFLVKMSSLKNVLP